MNIRRWTMAKVLLAETFEVDQGPLESTMSNFGREVLVTDN
jgi:hypothetical protein